MEHDLVRKAFELHEWINVRLEGLDIPRERRVLLGVLCHDTVIEHHVGVARLVQSNIYGTAFALVRVIFDAFVRGVWINRCATKDQIESYVADRLNVKFWQMLEEVEREDGFQDQVLSGLKKRSWRAMNSYTHAGILQLGRRISGGDIRPEYAQEEIDEVLKLTGLFALLSFQQIVTKAGEADLALEASRKMEGSEAIK